MSDAITEAPCLGVANPNKIDDFEVAVLASGVPLLDVPTTHRFTPGLYIREVAMKAGVIYTTRTHKLEHPFVMSSGSVSVYHGDGSVRHLKAPLTGVTPAGARRVIVVHEDAIWTTFHVTSETNIEKLEELLVEPRPQHADKRHSLTPDATPKAIPAVS